MLSTKVKWTVLAIVAVALVISASASFSQDYVTKGCICHKAKNPTIIDGAEKTAHPKALQDAATAGAIVATFDANAPIKQDQIKYVLGVGHRSQAYIGADLNTLPAEWSVADKKWVTTSVQDAKTQCLGCHTTGYDATKATWAIAGVTCQNCHGPASLHTSTMDKTKILNPKSLTPDKEAMVCGQCHSKGTDTTKTYAFPITYKPGGDLSAAFIDAQPKTAGRNQQYSDWKTSKHAANNVICTKCHDQHGASTTEPFQLIKPIVALCTGCHADKDIAKHAPTAPAGATCATCHMPNGRHTFAKPGA